MSLPIDVVLQNFGIPDDAVSVVSLNHPFNWENTTDLLLDLEEKLKNLDLPLKIQKKLSKIVTEAVDNVCRHGLKAEDNKLSSFTCKMHDNVVYMATRNLVSSTEIKKLVDMIEEINNSDLEEINLNFRAQLKHGKMDRMGNAGLGFYQMARKSTSPIRYNFSSNDIDNAYFTYLITVDTKQ
jgi:hypothetical protein